jgi:uncharacterized protein (TIGR03663 family)
VAALAIALAFRLAGLDARPMHHDEANQAVKFGTLLETGEYRYDRNDHHGPTLYYLTLPSAWLRGQSTLASLDERTLRLVPALFGAGLILLLLLLAGGLGRTAVAAGAFLVALSPALTYYSRFYIQETLLVFFSLGFLAALGRYLWQPGTGWAAVAGLCAGMAYSTKETSLIVLLAVVVAAVLARAWTGARLNMRARGSTLRHARGHPEPCRKTTSSPPGAETQPAPVRPEPVEGRTGRHIVVGLLAAVAAAFVLYSSFLRHPAGFLESFRAFSIYATRGIEPGSHAEPWYFYLRLLALHSSGGLVWTEGLVLGLAIIGSVAVARNAVPFVLSQSKDEHEAAARRFWPRYLALYSVLTAVAFSAVRYKTPWNLLPFYAGFVVLAGHGAASLIDRIKPRAARAVVIIAFLAAACHLGVQNWRANFRYAADPRNPYVYAQTVPDFLRLVQRVSDLAAIHPDRTSMLIKVIAGPYEQWPLPWYLRRMTRVGYWVRAADAVTPAEAPVIVASQENVAALDGALGDRHVSEFYGLRPEVVLTVFIERGLWERFLASR